MKRYLFIFLLFFITFNETLGGDLSNIIEYGSKKHNNKIPASVLSGTIPSCTTGTVNDRGGCDVVCSVSIAGSSTSSVISGRSVKFLATKLDMLPAHHLIVV